MKKKFNQSKNAITGSLLALLMVLPIASQDWPMWGGTSSGT